MVLSSLWRSILDALDDIAEELSPSLSSSSTLSEHESTLSEQDEAECRGCSIARPSSAFTDEGEDTLDHVVVNWEDKTTPGEYGNAEHVTEVLESEADEREEPKARVMSIMSDLNTKSTADSRTDVSAVSGPILTTPEVVVQDSVPVEAKQDRSDSAWHIDEPRKEPKGVETAVGNESGRESPADILSEVPHATDQDSANGSTRHELEIAIVDEDKPRNAIELFEEANGTFHDWFGAGDEDSFSMLNNSPSVAATDVEYAFDPSSCSLLDKLIVSGDDFILYGGVLRSGDTNLNPGQQAGSHEDEHKETISASNDAEAASNSALSSMEQSEDEFVDSKTSISSCLAVDVAAKEKRQSKQAEEIFHEIDATSEVSVQQDIPASSPTTPTTPLADTSDFDIEVLSPRSTTSRHSSASFSSSLSRKSDKWSSTEPATPVIGVSTDNASPSAPLSGSWTGSARDALRMGIPRTGSRARYLNVLGRLSKDPSSVKRLKLRGGGVGGGEDVKRDGRAGGNTGMWDTSFAVGDSGMLM